MIVENPLTYINIIRLYNSSVLNPCDLFETIAKNHFGVQSQTFYASAIAFAIRTKKSTFSDLMREINAQRLVRLWGIRTTLHIYHQDDWEYLLSYLTSVSNWYSSKLIKMGIDATKQTEKAAEIIKDLDYFKREDLIKSGIDAEFLGHWGDLLILLNNQGYIFNKIDCACTCRIYGNTKNVIRRNIEVFYLNDDIRRELALRYFRTYAPATINDFAHWLGISIKEANGFLGLIRDDLTAVMCDGRIFYINSADVETFAGVFREYQDDDRYHLLPNYDPLLLAYCDKSWVADIKHQKDIWRPAGYVAGIVLRRGKAIATWKYKLTKKHIDFEVALFQKHFSMEKFEKCCQSIANFFERPIGNIVMMEDIL